MSADSLICLDVQRPLPTSAARGHIENFWVPPAGDPNPKHFRCVRARLSFPFSRVVETVFLSRGLYLVEELRAR
jgi:hypothetical protein